MRKIPYDSLRAGMKVALPVYGSDGGKMISKDVILTDEYINKIISKGIPSVYIEDSISEAILVEDVISESDRVKAKGCMKNIFTKIRGKSSFDDSDYDSASVFLKNMVDQLSEGRHSVYNLVDITPEENYLYGHCVNVCILSVMTGISMGYNRNQLDTLAAGALFHDIGMALIPEEITWKRAKLSREELQIIGGHPDNSLKLLRQVPSISSVSRMIAYQHHERLSGGGYPQGLKKDDIHEMSQIVGVADVYDAVTADRAYRKALPAKDALNVIWGAGNKYFSFRVVENFLCNVAAYPVGTVVRLNTGEVAIVTENIKGQSLKPKVRIIRGNGELPRDVINLSEKTDIYIEDVLNEKEAALTGPGV